MTAQIIPFPVRQAQAPRPELQLKTDDYSVRVTSPADRIFWVRAKLAKGELVVTDFNPGGLDESMLQQALDMIVAHYGAGTCEQVVFRNLVPHAESEQRYSMLLHRAAERAKRACAAYAAVTGRIVNSFRLAARGEQVDAVAVFDDNRHH